MNFDEALEAHIEWKRRLIEYLEAPDGTLDANIISRDDVCLLGRWLHGEGKSIDYLPEMKDLIEEHKNFHQITAQILRKGTLRPEIAKQLEQGSNDEFQKSTARITFLLRKIKSICAYY